MRIEIPDFCIVVLVGASASGKSTFAAKHFLDSEILSSDHFRKMVADDATNQDANRDAFDCLHFVAAKRLARRRLTVIDATNIQADARAKILDQAREHHCQAVAIVMPNDENICLERNAAREEGRVADRVIRLHCRRLVREFKRLKRESFFRVFELPSGQEAIEIKRVPLRVDLRGETGPFDIIGDVHGCHEELIELLQKLGYSCENGQAVPPAGRKAVFVGDLADRGPNSPAVLDLVMNMVEGGHALCLMGNHDDKLMRYLHGRNVQLINGLEKTVEQLQAAGPEFAERLKNFLGGLHSHYMLDGGKLTVAHAGIPEYLQGRMSGATRSFCLYGETTGAKDEYGLPERLDWAKNYRGSSLVVYGHTPVPRAGKVNNTICLDEGCVFGGNLAALRYPEMEIERVAARRQYSEPARPLKKKTEDYVPEISDFLGRKQIQTSLLPAILLNEASTSAALEVFGRFCADPRFLIHLPPTMSPCETAEREDYLEYPTEAFAYYSKRAIPQVVCEEKHMGSRGLAIVFRNGQTAARFGFKEERDGIFLSRTGRPFFDRKYAGYAKPLQAGLRAALEDSGFFAKYATDWVLLDCEILPWSFKAQGLLAKQYAPCGDAGLRGFDESLALLDNYAAFAASGARPDPTEEEREEVERLRARLRARGQNIRLYNQVWQSYCSPVNAIEDVQIAPFNILATEEKVWIDTPHAEQLKILHNHLNGWLNYRATRFLELDLAKAGEEERGVEFWHELVNSGAEGMVVKSSGIICRHRGELCQPAVKCRGREYLRIIYGPDYTDKLGRFKKRSLYAKRNRAIREFALGQEALQRFVNHEPFHRVQECVFGILALESEPMDARL